MGVFTIELEIGDPQATRFERVSALVDTGASHTSLPASMLRNLGVTPHDRGRFQLANGQIVLRDVGQTSVRLDGRIKATVVVFGDEGSMPLLGAVTLGEFRLGVDPVAQKLVEVTAYLT
ncbi:MAG: retroviral-like aspartic protease family protein [Chloroflexota bacterium]|nr:retroviral-like aspartic protease family protein [Chloroflexota bacterium]